MAKDDVIEKGEKKYRMVELPIDPPLTVKRFLVPIDTTEEEIPVGARLLSEAETTGMLSRAETVENILVGDLVRLAESSEDETRIRGTVDAKLRSGKLTVSWENGMKSRHEVKELRKIW